MSTRTTLLSSVAPRAHHSTGRARFPSSLKTLAALTALTALAALGGCSADAGSAGTQPITSDDAGTIGDVGGRPTVAPVAHPAHYATQIVSFTQGDGGGYGADRLPDIIEGPPEGGGCCYGSTDVLSLGNGGEIVLASDVEIVDGPGADFIVFENAFEIANDPNNVFTELGEVSVSEDGVTWTTFPCDPTPGASRATCAGVQPVYATADDPVDVTASEKAGGDRFDLSSIGVARAKYVRIRDLHSNRPAQQGMAGFDLDAMAVLHW